MPDLKQHGTAAAVAALVAAGAQQALPPKTIEKPVEVTVAASRFAWPDLSDAQIDELGIRAKWLSKTKVQIFCDGADCRDLQTSIDNALEDAGVSSDRAIPFSPLGYGIEIMYGVGNWDKAQHLAEDLEAASGGHLVAHVAQGIYVNAGELIIAIGKRPRKADCGSVARPDGCVK